MKTYKIITSTEELLYLSHFTGVVTHGYYVLTSVHLAPDFSAVATDGHVLCRTERAWTYDLPAMKEPTEDEKIPAEGFTIFMDAMTIKQLKLLNCPGSVRIEIDLNDDDNISPYEHSEVRITDDRGLTAKTHLVEPGLYPDWHKVYDGALALFKEPSTCGILALNPDLLSKFTGWSKLAKQKTKDYVQISCRDQVSPVLIKVSSNSRVTGLLMPVQNVIFGEE